MGTRGPLRRPDSVRGKVEEKRNPTPAISPERVTAPSWLTDAEKTLFAELADDLFRANVPVRSIDRHAIAMWTRNIRMARECEDPREFARLNRDVIAWTIACGGTPSGRARLNIKAAEPKKGAILSLMDRAKTLSNG